MSQFYGVFFEESQEHLDSMEHLLMKLSIDNPDMKELNSIFRAAHSIKGGSGVFGFDALTGLTHVMESIFELARTHKLMLTKLIVDQLLKSVDTLKHILNCYQNEQEIDWNNIGESIAALENFLKEDGDKHNQDDNQRFGFFNQPVANSEETFGFFEDTSTFVKDQPYGIFAEEDMLLVTPFESLATESNSIKPSETITKVENSFTVFEDVDVASKSKISNSGQSNFLTQPENPASRPSSKDLKISPQHNMPTTGLIKNEGREANSIRVDTLKIDSLVNLVGELVITQSMIKIVGKDVHGEIEDRLDGAINQLSRNVHDIQEAVLSMRMLPMSYVFNRFPRVVRDLSEKLDKDVDLVIEGGATEIDKGLIEKLVDPLTHLIRNSIDHGIETPTQRVAAGKPEKGVIILSAKQRSSSIIITISDDGAGLNRSKILDKAMSRGLAVSHNMPDEKIWPLIFEAGFSTSETVTDVSGRGVGMDVVRSNIEAIGGLVEIESHEGIGSAFKIQLPLTLAIVDGMCVSVAKQTFIVPLTNIVESMQPTKEQLNTIQNDYIIKVRDEYWPLVALHQVMGVDNAITDFKNAIVVLVETSRKRFGIVVDALKGQQQVVIKSLEQHYKKVPGVAGATILGNGNVAMILDVESLAANIKQPAHQELSVEN